MPSKDQPRSEEVGAAGEEARKPFLLRLPAPLLDDLRAWAAQDLRSLNGHIEFLLREAVRKHKKPRTP